METQVNDVAVIPESNLIAVVMERKIGVKEQKGRPSLGRKRVGKNSNEH
jgi:hypothetical protein